MVAQVASIFPAAAEGIVSTVVAESYTKSGTAVISIAAIASLWAASMGVHSLTKGIDRIYNSDKPKSIIRLRLKSMIYTLAVFAVLIFWLGIFVFGDTISRVIVRELPWAEGIVNVLGKLENLWTFLVLFFFLLVMYTIIPNRKLRVIAQIPGTLISTVGCMGISKLFAHYYEDLLGFSSVYGGLTILVFFMLWLFFCLYSLFIGAEVNKCTGEQMENNSVVET